MSLQVSAPGKLLLLGEYAVLHGAPALVAAIDRRVRATLEPVDPDAREARHDSAMFSSFCLEPPGIVAASAAAAPAHSDALPRFVIDRLIDSGRLEPGHLDRLRISLDSGRFFRDGVKLGLGSSAALTVALSTALLRAAGHADALADPERLLDPLIELHAAWQHGQGSGADVAASLLGGLITFQRDTGAAARVGRVHWPSGLCMLCLWSGRGAVTAQYLQEIERVRRARPAAHAEHMSRLTALAQDGCDAAMTGDGPRLLAAIAAYAEALDNFGRACGIDIVSAEHQRLGQLAAEAGAVYKPSGAGGGDIGIAFAAGAAPLARLRASAAREAFAAVELEIDGRGVDCG